MIFEGFQLCGRKPATAPVKIAASVAAEQAGLSRTMVQQAVAVYKTGNEEVVEAMDKGEVAVGTAHDAIRGVITHEEFQARRTGRPVGNPQLVRLKRILAEFDPLYSDGGSVTKIVAHMSDDRLTRRRVGEAIEYLRKVAKGFDDVKKVTPDAPQSVSA